MLTSKPCMKIKENRYQPEVNNQYALVLLGVLKIVTQFESERKAWGKSAREVKKLSVRMGRK